MSNHDNLPLALASGPSTIALQTTEECAAMLRLAPQTLRADRCRKRLGIPFLQIGRAVRYDRDAVLRWLAAQQEARP